MNIIVKTQTLKLHQEMHKNNDEKFIFKFKSERKYNKNINFRKPNEIYKK